MQSVGRLAHNKGYESLIQAFQLVTKRVPDAVLHLAVGGENLTARAMFTWTGVAQEFVALAENQAAESPAFSEAAGDDHWHSGD